MALLEKKSGRRKLYFEIKQYANVLSVKDWGDGDERLTGYLRYSTEAEASKQRTALLVSKAEEGFKVSDEEAKALLKGPVIEKKDKVLPLPFRQDFHFYNEATGFTICSAKLLGKEIDDTSARWKTSVKKGLLIPVALIQDDSFNLRLVVGDEMSALESTEWVGKIESCLDLDKGELCIGAGAEHLYGDSDDAEEADEYLQILKLPPGKYNATLYMYVPGINGFACLDEIAGGYDKHEPLLPWFRRTRNNQSIPLWLQNLCVSGCEIDPSNPTEFTNNPFIDSEQIPEMIDFLLHLQPASELSSKDAIDPDSGWFPEMTGARIPVNCPIGIEALNLIKKEPKCNVGPIVYPRNVFELLSSNEPKELDGGLILDLDEILDVVYFAHLTHPNSMMEIRMSGLGNLELLDWAEDIEQRIVQVAFSAGQIGILFGNDLPTSAYISEIQKLFPSLKKLKDDVELELCFCNNWKKIDSVVPGAHRFRGKLKSAQWHLDSVYPSNSSSVIAAGLALARAVRSSALTVNEQAEFDTILKRAKKGYPYHFDDNEIVWEKSMVTVVPFDPLLLQIIGQAALDTRFPTAWKTNMSALLDGEGDDFDMNDFIQK